jgi:hypothetical protein
MCVVFLKSPSMLDMISSKTRRSGAYGSSKIIRLLKLASSLEIRHHTNYDYFVPKPQISRHMVSSS